MKYTFDSSVNLIKELGKIKEQRVIIHLKKGIYFTNSEDFIIRIPHLVIEGEEDVVIYDNRGHMRNCFPVLGSTSSLAHTILFIGESLELKNITIVNGCNIDFEYAGILYPKVSDVITQAYAIGAWNSQSVKAFNCKFLSILDTFDLKGVKELYVENSYTMGNNDFIGIADKTVYKNCSFKVLGSCPMWSASLSHLIFYKCRFDLDVKEDDTLYLTKRGGDLFLISCVFTSNLSYLQMEIKLQKTSRYYLYHNTWNNGELPLKGIDETFIYLTLDDVKKIENNYFDNYRIAISSVDKVEESAKFLLEGCSSTVDIFPSNPDLVCIKENNVLYVENKLIGKDQTAYIKIKSGFLEAITYFKQIGKKTGVPTIMEGLTYKIESGKVVVSYRIKEENASTVYVYQDDVLLYRLYKDSKTFPITKADIGKKFVLELVALSTSSLKGDPIKIETRVIEAYDMSSSICMNDLETFVLENQNHLYMKTKDALYLGEEIENVVHFEKGSDKCFKYMEGTDGALGYYGLVPVERGASLIYPTDSIVEGYSVNIVLRVEKKSGEGFGSANGQYLELWMNYREGFGIALRIEREIYTDKGCFISLRRYENNVNTRITDKVFTTAFRKTVFIKAIYRDGTLQFVLENEENSETLSCKVPKMTTSFMIRHTGTVGIGNRFVIQKIELKEE